MNDDRKARRAKMLDKVRKLLNMGRHAASNDTEAETAMRQANKLMAEFGIAEAECDMAAMQAGEMVYGQASCGSDGRAPEQGKVYRSAPVWCGTLGVGVARFTDSIIIRKRTENGELFVFQGEREDVLLARWLFGVLVESINRERAKSGWTGRSEANDFKLAAASVLHRRLRDLAAERRAMFEAAKVQSQSRALMVVDTKQAAIVQRFGEQRTSRCKARQATGAAMAGAAAGSRINIPSGRPIGNQSKAMLN